MDKDQKPHILVVDDEAGIRVMLKQRLVSWGYRVTTAHSGSQAFELIESGCPDILMTDLFMPDVDGFSLLEDTRRRFPDLPVIVISGMGELGDVVKVLRLGAWDYLKKPLENMAYLQITIDRVLERARMVKENHRYRAHLENMVAQQHVELQESEKRYRTLAQFAYNWEYWVSPSNVIHYTSPSCERITGYRAEEFCDNPELLRDIVHKEDRGLFNQHLDDVHQQHNICHLTFRIVRRDGQQRWIGHCCQPVTDDDGQYQGRRCSNQDITYEKQIEADLLDQKQALTEKTVSLDKTNQALKTLLEQRDIERKSIELSMVANLKRYVLPYLDELVRINKVDGAKAYVDIIRNNIEHLIVPVANRLSHAYLSLTPTEIKVADLIRQGQSTKSIATSLNTSTSTVEKHRNKIRKKFNILGKNVNLYTYLNSLS